MLDSVLRLLAPAKAAPALVAVGVAHAVDPVSTLELRLAAGAP